MRFVRLTLVMTSFAALTASVARGQDSAPVAPPSNVTTQPSHGADIPLGTQFFHLSMSEPQQQGEVLAAIRNIVSPSLKIVLAYGQNTIVARGSANDLAEVQRIIAELDKPKKAYRLTFTIADKDNGKRVGVEHQSFIAIAGQHTTLKQGSKFPIATGTYDSDNGKHQSQFTYLDIGLSFDVTLSETANGATLRSKIEQSSVADQPSGVGAQDPVIRQTLLEGSSVLVQGKPLNLGSIDIPGSTRRLDIEVLMEPVP